MADDEDVKINSSNYCINNYADYDDDGDDEDDAISRDLFAELGINVDNETSNNEQRNPSIFL